MPQDAQEELEPEELERAQLCRYLLVGVQATKKTTQRSHDAVQVVVLRLRLRLLQRPIACMQREVHYCSGVQRHDRLA